MAIEKAYLLPYSPLLIPEISKANYNFLDKSAQAYKLVADDLTLAKIDTIILISPHGPEIENTNLFNCAPEMKLDFQDFGFILNNQWVKGDIPGFDELKSNLESANNNFNFQYLSEPNLTYDSAIPLYLLNTLDVVAKSIILWPQPNLSRTDAFKLGELLVHSLPANNKKIAIIAVGNLSHRLSRKSPQGYSAKGAKFDNKLIEYLQNPKTIKDNLLNFDLNLITAAQETVLRPLSIALGVLNKLDYDPKILAYQTDFGIGYLSLDFRVNINKSYNE